MTAKPPLCDIVNKKMKKCVVCDLVFDSHKNFVDHCDTFHNQRFKIKTRTKTVSGDKRRFSEFVQIHRNDSINNNQESSEPVSFKKKGKAKFSLKTNLLKSFLSTHTRFSLNANSLSTIFN